MGWGCRWGRALLCGAAAVRGAARRMVSAGEAARAGGRWGLRCARTAGRERPGPRGDR